mgnify:FL=1
MAKIPSVKVIGENRILVAAALCAITGLAALLFVASYVSEPISVSLTELPASEGNDIVVKGYVSHIAYQKAHAVLYLQEIKAAKAVYFDVERLRKMNLTEGSLVEVTGEVRSYKGKPELVISQIRRSES